MAHQGFYMGTHLRMHSRNLVLPFSAFQEAFLVPILPASSRTLPTTYSHHSPKTLPAHSIANIQDFSVPAGHSLFQRHPSSFPFSSHSLRVLLPPLFQNSFFSPLPFSYHNLSESRQSLPVSILTTANWFQTHVYLSTGISTWTSKPRYLISIPFLFPATPIPPVFSLRNNSSIHLIILTRNLGCFLNSLSFLHCIR